MLIALIDGEPTAGVVAHRLRKLYGEGRLSVGSAVYAESLAGRRVTPAYLADFPIVAHAFRRADQLFTLDPQRYRRAFPALRLLETDS